MKTQNITIRIADAAPLSMTIDPSTEEVIRRAQYGINTVWNSWSQKFDKLGKHEILAMVTFQFAKLYYQLLDQVEHQQTILEEFESELDRLLDIAAPQQPGSKN